MRDELLSTNCTKIIALKSYGKTSDDLFRKDGFRYQSVKSRHGLNSALTTCGDFDKSRRLKC